METTILDRADGASTAESTTPSGREQKFIITAKRAGRILQWLDSMCRPDLEHPRALVSSIYFDTHQLHCVDEKLNSDYLKSKFRLRWYRVPGRTPAAGDPVFAEAKLRTGSIRRKLRAPAPFEAPWLQEAPLEDPRLLELNRTLRSLGAVLQQTLLPTLAIEYERRRYIDAVSGARLCVDAGIRVQRVNRMLLPRALPGALETAVFELKGDCLDLPPHLYTLTDLGCRRASWSKYAVCYQKLVSHNF